MTVKELKEGLTQLNLSTKGKKKALYDRLRTAYEEINEDGQNGDGVSDGT